GSGRVLQRDDVAVALGVGTVESDRVLAGRRADLGHREALATNSRDSARRGEAERALDGDQIAAVASVPLILRSIDTHVVFSVLHRGPSCPGPRMQLQY